MKYVNKKKLVFSTFVMIGSIASLVLFAREYGKRDDLSFWVSICASSLALLGNTITLTNRYHYYFFKQKKPEESVMDITEEPHYNSMGDSNAKLNR